MTRSEYIDRVDELIALHRDGYRLDTEDLLLLMSEVVNLLDEIAPAKPPEEKLMYRHKATDSNGDTYIYTHEPYCDINRLGWSSREGSFKLLYRMSITIGYNWTKSYEYNVDGFEYE